jgi:hypothetical protein
MSDSDGPEITEAANAAIAGLLPKKSKEVYEHTYHIFSEWCKGKKCPGKVNENILLAYFVAKSKTVKSSTLWSTYSMLKATINIKHNIDISKFNKLVPFENGCRTIINRKSPKRLQGKRLTNFYWKQRTKRTYS